MNIQLLNGTLSNLLEKQIIFEYPNEKIWNSDGVSLQRTILDNPAVEQKVSSALDPKNLTKYIVETSAAATTRCIDGRIIKDWSINSSLQTRTFGPKVAGGTAHAALAHRIVDSNNLHCDLNYEDDIRFVIAEHKKVGLGFGGHIDDHAHGWNTGCGAVDNINKILEKLQLPEPQEQLRGLTKIILGKGYDGKRLINEVIGRMLYLDALKPRYMPKEGDDPHGEFLYKKTITELIRQEADQQREPVQQLTGDHHEVGVLLNYVKNTTFDTDRFSADHNNQLQVFGWDIWEMYEEARLLYPYNMQDTQTTQRQAISMRMSYVTTRTLLGVATLMVLTDGSLHVITFH